MKKSCIYVN